MKKLLALFIVQVLFLSHHINSYSQNNEWIYFTSCAYVESLAEGDDFIWIGTSYGLYKINKLTKNTNLYTKINDISFEDISSLVIDENNYKWVGTKRGLIKFNGKNLNIYDTSNSGLPHNYVQVICIDDVGNKWIGTSGGGLAKYDGDNWKVYNTSN